MNEWSEKILNPLKLFLKEYGKIIFVFSFLLIGCILFAINLGYLFPSKLQVSFLDVGQGDAILVKTPSGKNMLIDGGPTHAVLSRLGKELSYFDQTIDVMIATHRDQDHIMGLIPVLEKYKVDTIVLSQSESETEISKNFDVYVKNEGSHIYRAGTGDFIDFGDGVIGKIIYAKKKEGKKENDTNEFSVSLLLYYKDISFLLTGDLPSTEESHLMTDDIPKNITVYKAGHHGSKTSSSEQLLSFIRPEYSIISAGKNNSYGHPHKEVLEILQKYSQEIISTIDRGTISFITDGRIIEIKSSK